MRPIILGISGGTGAGKTFTVNHLLEAYPEGDLTNQSNYYIASALFELEKWDFKNLFT